MAAVPPWNVTPPHTNYTNQKYENIEILASHPASGLWALGNLPPPDFSLAMPLLQPIKVIIQFVPFYSFFFQITPAQDKT